MVVITTLPPPTEGIRHTQANTSANIQGKDLGDGTLYIAESRLSWTDTNDKGFSLEYPAISLHAVSRDLTSFPHECLYVMLDVKLPDETEEAPDEDEDEANITEIRFIPSDKSSLDAMFEAMAHCQALHPDEEDNTNSEDSENYEDAIEGAGDGENDGQWYTGAEGVEHLTEEGLANFERIENLLIEGTNNQQNTMDITENNGQNTAGDIGDASVVILEPAVLETEPEVVESEQGVAESEPGVAEMEPGVAESEPGVAEMEPGVAESEPGVAELEPGVAELEPGVAESEPMETDGGQFEDAQEAEH